MNKLERKQLKEKKDKRESRTNNLWVGMVTRDEYNAEYYSRKQRSQRDQLSYSMKEWDWKE